MQIHVFRDADVGGDPIYSVEQTKSSLERIAETTDTRELVVAIYLLARRKDWFGHFVNTWRTPSSFVSGLRKWSFTREFGTPRELPEKFRLIRVAIEVPREYPRTETDRYGWKFRYEGFQDQLAELFAHELHHYRRYHLGLHPNEGEQSANKWGAHRAADAGFGVKVEHVHRRQRRCRPKKKKTSIPEQEKPRLVNRLKLMAARLCADDLAELQKWIWTRQNRISQEWQRLELEQHEGQLKQLPAGAPIMIRMARTSSARLEQYVDTKAKKVRNLKSGSHNMLVEAFDGTLLSWPMCRIELYDDSVPITDLPEVSSTTQFEPGQHP